METMKIIFVRRIKIWGNLFLICFVFKGEINKPFPPYKAVFSINRSKLVRLHDLLHKGTFKMKS